MREFYLKTIQYISFFLRRERTGVRVENLLSPSPSSPPTRGGGSFAWFKAILNSKGLSVLFLVIAMMLMVTIGYVFSYLIPTKQKSVSLTVSSNQAFFLAQSGVEFAVRYATDQGWSTTAQLNGLDGMTRNLGRGRFTLDYNSTTDQLTSVGEVLNASQRRIVVSNFTQFVSGGVLIIDPARPVPCLTTGLIGKQTVNVVNFYIINNSSSSITLNAFQATWTQDPPTRQVARLYLGGTLKFDGNYPNGGAPQSFSVPPLTFTINAGQSVLVSVWFTRLVNNLQNMIITLYSTTGDSYNFNLDPEGDGLPPC